MKSIGVEPKENKPASEQASKLTSRQAPKQGEVGGWARRPQAHRLQAIRRQAVREPTSAEYSPNHSLPRMAFRDGLQADRGARSFHKVLLFLQEALEEG